MADIFAMLSCECAAKVLCRYLQIHDICALLRANVRLHNILRKYTEITISDVTDVGQYIDINYELLSMKHLDASLVRGPMNIRSTIAMIWINSPTNYYEDGQIIAMTVNHIICVHAARGLTREGVVGATRDGRIVNMYAYNALHCMHFIKFIDRIMGVLMGAPAVDLRVEDISTMIYNHA